MRVLEAKRWLSNTETGIAEIAFRLNIIEGSGLLRVRFFKKQTGLYAGRLPGGSIAASILDYTRKSPTQRLDPS